MKKVKGELVNEAYLPLSLGDGGVGRKYVNNQHKHKTFIFGIFGI